MTTTRHVRTAAARIDGCAEVRAGASSSFTAAGTEFARLSAATVTFWLGPAESVRRRPDLPTAVETIHDDGCPGLQVRLDDVNGMQVNALLTAAHAHRAPDLVVPRPAAAPGRGLPRNLGRPATRALEAAGLTTLEAVAAHGRAATAALHGVGPRAVERLQDALAAAGLGWS